ncbi:hypothetical protein DWU89_16065 [Parabacteroides acidifaciens]|uniref:Uncharacterized protein n=1 Tax=Parabacteroides acidifaciens TaxID=2290935 RepID=A0A3D8HAS2_9BACT|nr:hypothetical protein DWU89_16065 [Parabacteroides acidifaciens]RHR56587.1 hypothetical protein DWW90_12425 [Parabacteroides sp. AF17-28]
MVEVVEVVVQVIRTLRAEAMVILEMMVILIRGVMARVHLLDAHLIINYILQEEVLDVILRILQGIGVIMKIPNIDMELIIQVRAEVVLGGMAEMVVLELLFYDIKNMNRV